MTVAIVAGALGSKPGNGGEAWVRLSWVLGLARLGVDVWLIEEIADDACVDGNGDLTPVRGVGESGLVPARHRGIRTGGALGPSPGGRVGHQRAGPS